MIKSVEINWMDGWANHPSLTVNLDKRPNFQDYIYDVKDNFYFGLIDGIASFYYHDSNNEMGFGGHEYVLKMKDGSIKKIKGPWSSRAEIANKFGFGPIIDCSIRGYNDTISYGGCGVLIKDIYPFIKSANIPEWINIEKIKDPFRGKVKQLPFPSLYKRDDDYGICVRMPGGGLFLKDSSTFDGIQAIDDRFFKN